MTNNIGIKLQLINQLYSGKIHDSGYTLSNGNKYVEIRCVQFMVDKNYIFDIPEFVDESWYENNYDPIINTQYDHFIYLLNSNVKTRQAVMNISLPNNLQCTMYVHVFIDNDNMTYIVHMRSNDAVEFRSDLKWHRKLINRIIKDIKYDISNVDIIWNADSMQFFDKYWNYVN